MVSHSRALAQAAVALAAEMTQGCGPTVAVAAGLDETTFGTDATAVADAILQAESPDGVLVLMDLGSAVMAAELALELLDSDLAARVTLCSAPLVEGLVAAVVTAASGAPLPAVTVEALRGLAAKQQHIGDATPPAAEPDPRDAEVSRDVEVLNANGFHARPAANLVALLSTFDAELTITNLTRGIGPVVADSMIMLVSLDSRAGDQLRVSANGPDAAAAVATTVDFIAAGLGE
ncbi:dihydroxyacetone kinase phosphoryl donor subunit DhaM [Mycobacterium sp. EPa45]|uniref:dihydroxyacetone kinase phosphoryl donor subunit DhaM n=1 Tax=Mycobacterium sp. EPa45 TaxID=1545728 RepID=UPI000A6FEC2F|nr:dihydroxyacetone kinase phosphoryl donor subunit DhaM [Mycobacterium sp. EPa45]